MKRKINIQFTILSIVAVVLTLILATGVNYQVFKTEVMSNLKIYAQVFVDTNTFEDTNSISKEAKYDDLRVTIIKPDGTVIYDNFADVAKMENHKNRPEVKQARESGEGENIRHSKTLGMSTFYYAKLLDNGNILRVAKETKSIWSVFASIIPALLVLCIILFLLSIIWAKLLTRSIVEPIEQLANDMDHLESVYTYDELKPFVAMIQKQHEDIRKNADMRQEFTANVSHELKTPLTSISGYSELIESGMASEEDISHFAKEIHQNANRLLTLINDIIRLSELDVSTQTVLMEELDLYEVAKRCVNSLEVNATNHDVTISCEGESAKIEANKEMMNELIFNLCDNAIRYNKKGGSVKVNIKQDPRTVFLTIEDTGIGIPKEHQKRVFERFYRVDKSRSKLTGGTGLGLAIVKHIVAQNDADIDLVSEENVGTKITVIFYR